MPNVTSADPPPPPRPPCCLPPPPLPPPVAVRSADFNTALVGKAEGSTQYTIILDTVAITGNTINMSAAAAVQTNFNIALQLVNTGGFGVGVDVGV